MMTKAIKQRLKHLHVHTSQGYGGLLARESQILFSYRTADPACEVSLTMPLTIKTYASNILPGVLRQNLPEGFLETWMHERFGKTMKMDDFNMLALTGREMIGRVRCSLAEHDSTDMPTGESLAELLSWKGSESLFDHLAGKYAAISGVSGAQPKVLMSASTSGTTAAGIVEKGIIKDRNLIVKAAGEGFPGLAENEYHCMRIAQQAGVPVPAFWLSDNREVFVIERFDIDAATGMYLGFEDMTALTGRQNSQKYEGSYEIVAQVIDRFVAQEAKKFSFENYFKSLVLSVVLRNGDAHLKNFGLLYSTPMAEDTRLSPIYDIVNTTVYLPKDILALKMDRQKGWPTRRQLIEFGKMHCRIDRPESLMDAMVEAAFAYRPNITPGQIWAPVSAEIAKGIHSIGTKHQY